MFGQGLPPRPDFQLRPRPTCLSDTNTAINAYLYVIEPRYPPCSEGMASPRCHSKSFTRAAAPPRAARLVLTEPLDTTRKGRGVSDVCSRY